MIDIIIPCYNAHKTLKKTLNSIASQTIKNKINVLLVDDCSTKDYNYFLKSYKKLFPISILHLNKNSGPGVAREMGMIHTHNQYIVFIDSDDYFYDSNSLELLFNKIEENYDYVNSIEFDQKRGRILLSNGNVHGKIYRRDFLIKNDIHFNNSRFHEDNYFNNLVILSDANYVNIPICTYFYAFNKNSITNKNFQELDQLETYLKNSYDLARLAKKRGYSNKRLNQFLCEKYRYLYRLYYESDEKQQYFLKKLIKKYDPILLNILSYNKASF